MISTSMGYFLTLKTNILKCKVQPSYLALYSVKNQSPNHDILKFNASIPLKQSNPQPYEHYIVLHNPPYVQGDILSLG